MNGVNKQNTSLDVLKKTLNGMKARLGEVNNEQLLSEIAQMESQIQSLQSAVDERAAQIKEKEDFDKNRENFNNELKGKYDQRKELSDKRSGLQFAYNLWTESHDEKAENVRNTEEQIRAAQEKKAELENNEDLSFSERRKLVSEQNKKLKDLNAALKEQKEELNSNDLYDKTGNTLNEISEQSRALSKEINEMEAKAAKFDGMEQRIKDNEAEIDKSIANLRKTMGSLGKSVSDEVKRVKDEKASAERAAQAEKDELKQYKKDITWGVDLYETPANISEKDLKELNAFKKSFEGSVSHIMGNLDRDLIDALDPEQLDRTKAKNNLKNMNMAVNDLEKQLDADKKLLEEKQKKADDIAKKYEKELADLLNKRDSIGKEQNDLRTEAFNTEKRIKEAEKNGAGKYNIGLRIQKNKEAKLDKQIDEKQKEYNELNDKINKMRDEIHTARADAKGQEIINNERERIMKSALNPIKDKIKEVNDVFETPGIGRAMSRRVQISIENAMAKNGKPPKEQTVTQPVNQVKTPSLQKSIPSIN